MEFIPSLPILLTFSVATFLLAITPGPDMTLFVARSLSQGRLAGFITMIGASSGIVVHTLLAAFGVSALIAVSQTGFFILKIVGALYLLWLAIDAIRNGSALDTENKGTRKLTLFQNWITGVGVNLLNPKIVIFFITFLPQFVSPTDPDAASKMIFLGLYFIALAAFIATLVILLVDWLADMLKSNRRIMRTIDWLFAGVFSAFAIRLLFVEGK